VRAAVDAQQSTARLDQSFKNVGLSSKKYAGAIDEAERASRKLGFANVDTKGALGSLITATGDAHKSMQDLAVAQDYARFKGVELGDATKTITMAMTGSQRAAKQLGIAVSPVTSSYDALKATMGTTIDATEKLQLAHAKLTDKMATGQAVIDAVSAKVHGQSEAFASTAAGGMAQFHAQLNNLEEKIGAGLLPAMTQMVSGLSSAVDWVTTHWPEIERTIGPVMQNVRQVIGDVITTAEAFWHRFGRTIETVLGDVVRIVQGALKVVGDLFKIAGDLLRGDWGKLWTDLKNLVGDALHLVVALIKGEWDLVRGVMSTLGSMALDGLKAGLSGLGGLVSRAVGAGVAAIRDLVDDARSAAARFGGAIVDGIEAAVRKIAGLAKLAFAEAEAIGRSIVGGVLSGVGSLASDLFHSMSSAIGSAMHGVRSVFKTHSPSLVFAEQIGVPLAEGVLQGFRSVNLRSGLLDHMKTAKAGLDDWAGSTGVDNMTGVGAAFGGALNAGFAGSLSGAAAALAGKIGTGSSALSGLSTAFDTPTFTLGRTVAMAAGGIVTMPTLALLGERGPEAVVPLNRAVLASPGGGTVINNFSFPNYVGSKDELVRVVSQELNRNYRRGTGLLGTS
jgi:hypothetical protein